MGKCYIDVAFLLLPLNYLNNSHYDYFLFVQLWFPCTLHLYLMRWLGTLRHSFIRSSSLILCSKVIIEAKELLILIVIALNLSMYRKQQYNNNAFESIMKKMCRDFMTFLIKCTASLLLKVCCFNRFCHWSLSLEKKLLWRILNSFSQQRREVQWNILSMRKFHFCKITTVFDSFLQ